MPVGTALFAQNSTLPAGASVGNSTASNATAEEGVPILLSASYTFTIDEGKYAGDAVFVMGQTPLSVNATVPALLMHLQPAVDGLGAKWVNKTGKAIDISIVIPMLICHNPCSAWKTNFHQLNDVQTGCLRCRAIARFRKTFDFSFAFGQYGRGQQDCPAFDIVDALLGSIETFNLI